MRYQRDLDGEESQWQSQTKRWIRFGDFIVFSFLTINLASDFSPKRMRRFRRNTLTHTYSHTHAHLYTHTHTLLEGRVSSDQRRQQLDCRLCVCVCEWVYIHINNVCVSVSAQEDTCCHGENPSHEPHQLLQHTHTHTHTHTLQPNIDKPAVSPHDKHTEHNSRSCHLHCITVRHYSI